MNPKRVLTISAIVSALALVAVVAFFTTGTKDTAAKSASEELSVTLRKYLAPDSTERDAAFEALAQRGAVDFAQLLADLDAARSLHLFPPGDFEALVSRVEKLAGRVHAVAGASKALLGSGDAAKIRAIDTAVILLDTSLTGAIRDVAADRKERDFVRASAMRALAALGAAEVVSDLAAALEESTISDRVQSASLDALSTPSGRSTRRKREPGRYSCWLKTRRRVRSRAVRSATWQTGKTSLPSSRSLTGHGAST